MDRALTPAFWVFTPETDSTTGPLLRQRGSPVFIHDAVTPWGHETMLLKLLRDQASDQEE